MNLFKMLAKKICANEFAEFTDKIELLEEQKKEFEEYPEKYQKEMKKSSELSIEKGVMECQLKKLEKENEILRKYYELDKEPSDEIKTKIHIDLEVNRLKEENLKLLAMSHIAIQQPMYGYPHGVNYGFRNTLI